jgi:hypothetical protein
MMVWMPLHYYFQQLNFELHLTIEPPIHSFLRLYSSEYCDRASAHIQTGTHILLSPKSLVLLLPLIRYHCPLQLSSLQLQRLLLRLQSLLWPWRVLKNSLMNPSQPWCKAGEFKGDLLQITDYLIRLQQEYIRNINHQSQTQVDSQGKLIN